MENNLLSMKNKIVIMINKNRKIMDKIREVLVAEFI
jgi:hypothetical protein